MDTNDILPIKSEPKIKEEPKDHIKIKKEQIKKELKSLK